MQISIMQVYTHTLAESSSNYRKPSWYPTLRGIVQSVCIQVYVELGECSAMQPTTLKFYVHHAILKCENGTDII